MTPEDVLIPARTSERADFITVPKEEAAAVEIGLNAAIVSMIGGEPQILPFHRWRPARFLRFLSGCSRP